MPEPIETSIQEDIQTLYRALPQTVQVFLASTERDEVARAIGEGQKLTKEQFSAFENAFLLLMLGAFTPEKFFADLLEAGISEESARGIAADLDAKVFLPLARAEAASTKEEAAPQAAETLVVAAPVAVIPPPAPVAPAALIIPPPNPPAAVVPPVPPPIAVAARPSVPQIRTMAQDVEAVGLVGGAPSPVARPALRPIPPPTPAPAPRTVSATPSPDTLHADLKKYGIDPYREPVE